MKVAAQADVLSQGYEHLVSPPHGRVDNRSRSVESGKRSNLGARPKETSKENVKKERSLQDIDKDIETIWRELQDLDKPETKSTLR